MLVCYCTCYSRLLGPDASVYANGLVKTGGFTSAWCIATAEGGLRKRHNVSCEKRPARNRRRLRAGRRVQMHKFSRLTKIAPASRVSANINGHVGSPTVRCTYVARTYTVAQATRRSEKVSSRRAISCAPRNTIYILCVTLSSYPRFVFAAQVCKVHAVRHPRRWKFPFGNVMTDFAGRNRGE